VDKSPWYQTNLWAGILAGAIVLFAGSLLNAAVKDLDFWQRVVVYLGVAAIVLLAVSGVKKSWREHTWKAFGHWLRGLGVTTNKRRAAYIKVGYDARDAEVIRERDQANQRPPDWRVDQKSLTAEGDMYWLNNDGYGVLDVMIGKPDSALFEITEAPKFTNPFQAGQWFRGNITKLGREKGVVFPVKWRDQNGDDHDSEAVLTPGSVHPPQESPESAYARGKADLQAEVDKLRTIPILAPAWHIERSPGTYTEFSLSNEMSGAVATHVHLRSDAHNMFAIHEGGQWDDLTGKATKVFTGRATDAGIKEGMHFTLEWTDEHGFRAGPEYIFLDGWASELY